MASDIVVRQALAEPPGDVVVAISMFSEAVSAQEPRNLLVIAGEWEARLAEEAPRAVRQIDPDAQAGETIRDPDADVTRRAVIAPQVEHVGVLYSRTALEAAGDWLDASFARESDGPVALRGGWIALLLGATITLGWPLARALPAGRPRTAKPLDNRRFLAAALRPVIAVPLLLWPMEMRLLPVLVADYLAVHLGLYGLIKLALLARWGMLRGQFPLQTWWIAGAVALFGIVLFGGMIDRYVTSFFPHPGRAVVIAGLALGAIPFMLGDAVLTDGGRAPYWRLGIARGAFLASLALAVALDFEALFFLLFGTMAGWVGRQTGLPAAAGPGLGLVLAWALGVTFLLFDSV